MLALICDSTNALREGDSPSEKAVGPSLRTMIEEAKGRVAITSFSSNVGRIRLVAEAARDAGREVLVLGRSMKRVIDVAGELGYMDGLPKFLAEEEYRLIPRDKLVVICTGSQGEARAALAKLARSEMKTVALSPGDTVIFSSRTIPGNEKAILEIKNQLIDQGVKIIEDGDALVHVSGHPRRNELRKMYRVDAAADRRAGARRGRASGRAGLADGDVRHHGGGAGARRRHAAAVRRVRPRSSTRCRSAASTRTAS